MERILVIEDDPHIAELFQRELSKLGYATHVYPKSRGALDEAVNFGPDLAILDVMLGDGLGYSVAREIRKHTGLYRIPILFASVIGEEQDVAHAFEEGGDEYLVKPFSLKQLSASLDRMTHLEESINTSCAYTNMPGLIALRREVEHRLSIEEGFALTYVFFQGLNHYRKVHGTKMVQKISFLTSRAIRNVLKYHGIYESFSAHLGSGHFMVITEVGDRRQFRHGLQDYFRASATELQQSGVPPMSKSHGHQTLFTSSIHTGQHEYKHAGEMFDALRKVDILSEKDDSAIRRSEKKKGGHENWVE